MAHTLDKPKLVLRVGVAGAITVAQDQRASLHARLMEVFRVLAGQLETLLPAAGRRREASDICSYYAGTLPPSPPPPPPLSPHLPSTHAGEPHAANYPVLRVVSGVADGTDQIAFDALLAFEKNARLGREPAGRHTLFELVAVLPSDAASFRDNSEVKDKAAFNDLLRCCRYIIELDGNCVSAPPEPQRPDPLTSERRNRAFRVQSAVLLRQCDLLIAFADPNGARGAGGTRETMARAVELGIPVVFLTGDPQEGQDGVSIALRRSDLEGVPRSCATWRDDVDRVVSRILADPRTARAGTDRSMGGTDATEKFSPSESQLLDEFFAGVERKARIRPRIWAWFEKRFKQARLTVGDPPIEPFRAYRARAGELSAYYTGLYRGAFVVNYVLAVVAVILAVSSLVYLIVLARGGFANSTGSAATFALALVELIVLVLIFLNTHQGNRNGWNAKAIDYRYLAERLRSLYYLASAGSLRVSPPRAAQFAATALRQSVVDWLLQAIVRQSPPDTGLQASEPPLPERGTMSGRVRDGADPRVVRPDVRQAVAAVRDHWLEGQIAYHRATSDTQFRVHRWIEAWVWRLNVSVIIIVVVDLLLVIAVMLGNESSWARALHAYSPLLIFFAAVLPAVVASLNGIRFQSECLRIAERSAVMVKVLEGCRAECERLATKLDAARGNPNSDPGSWTLDVLDVAESCAQITADEVAEWSVLYSRALLEA